MRVMIKSSVQWTECLKVKRDSGVWGKTGDLICAEHGIILVWMLRVWIGDTTDREDHNVYKYNNNTSVIR